MPFRITLSAVCLIAVALLGGWVQQRQPAAIRIAHQMVGDGWYALKLDERQVGYFSTHASFDADGAWAYRSRTHVLLQQDEPLNIDKTLRFSPHPPYYLDRAMQQVTSNGVVTEQITLFRGADNQLTARTGDGAEKNLSWQFTLDQYLEVERWLSQGPEVEEKMRASVLDLSQLSLRKRTYELLATDPWRLSHEAPLGPSHMVLSRNFLPEKIQVSGLFDFQRTSFAQAMAPASPAFKASYKIPLAQPLRNLSAIETLELEIQGADLHLKSHRGKVSDASFDAHLATVLPVGTAQMRRMTDEAIDQTHSDEKALAALVAYVHHRLEYRATDQRLSVEQALDQGAGECTEFADLLTTLARTHGWSARTVYGLAYDGQSPPGLAMHAWNEIGINGKRYAVDATMNQAEVDAAHFEIDNDTMARLKYLRSGHQLSAVAVNVTYED